MAKVKTVTKKTNVNLYVYIPKSQKTALERVAKLKGSTLSGLLRNVLEDYLKKEIVA